MTAEEKLALALTALSSARAVIDYCGGGDSWERECNAGDMEIFYAACEKLDVKE